VCHAFHSLHIRHSNGYCALSAGTTAKQASKPETQLTNPYGANDVLDLLLVTLMSSDTMLCVSDHLSSMD
jgi:hypothetical protein